MYNLQPCPHWEWRNVNIHLLYVGIFIVRYVFKISRKGNPCCTSKFFPLVLAAFFAQLQAPPMTSKHIWVVCLHTVACPLFCQSARKCRWRDVGHGSFGTDETCWEDFYPAQWDTVGSRTLCPACAQLNKFEPGFCKWQLGPRLVCSLASGQNVARMF